MLWYEVARLVVFLFITGLYPDVLCGYFAGEIQFISTKLTLEFWLRLALVVLVAFTLCALASKKLVFFVWNEVAIMLDDFWSKQFGMNNFKRWENCQYTRLLKQTMTVCERNAIDRRHQLATAKLRMGAMLDLCMENGTIYENPLVLQCGHVVSTANYSDDRWCRECNYQRRMNGLPNIVLGNIVEQAKEMKRFYDTI